MWMIPLIPFCLQAIFIGIDEVYFHLKRGLPFWERIGHPLDTLSFLACLLIILLCPFNSTTLTIYSAFALLSCLLVTKDEFVHKEVCPGAENWLHAFLFLLHPIVLIVAAIMWPALQEVPLPSWLAPFFDNITALKIFLLTQTGAVFLFFCYQLIYWNLIWKETPK